jgi:hypothetical protein
MASYRTGNNKSAKGIHVKESIGCEILCSYSDIPQVQDLMGCDAELGKYFPLL